MYIITTHPYIFSTTKILNPEDLVEIDSDFELLKKVRNLLGLIEHLSVGINSGVFDEDLLYRMSGTHLVRIYRRLQTYIEYVQRRYPDAYIEYQELSQRFEKRSLRIRNNQGDILHS